MLGAHILGLSGESGDNLDGGQCGFRSIFPRAFRQGKAISAAGVICKMIKWPPLKPIQFYLFTCFIPTLRNGPLNIPFQAASLRASAFDRKLFL